MYKTINYSFAFAACFVLLITAASCDKQVSSTAPLPPVPTGKILFSSNPTGAQIFLNGDNTGKITPDSIMFLEPGVYTTKLRLYPFLDITAALTLQEQETESIGVNYFEDERNYGSIFCASNPPNALISIGDSATNKFTPDTLTSIWPGFYKIKCSLPQHRDGITAIQIRGGEDQSASFFLKDTSLSIDYSPQTSGMPGNISTCIAIDNRNVKWIGTSGYGLVKFDEKTWTIYNPLNSSLTTNKIHCIAVDQQNKKWIGTPDGLYTIDDGGNWEIFKRTNSDIPNDFINDISFDSKGNVWIGASDAVYRRYLLKFDGNQWNYFEAEGLITALAVDKEDNIWVGRNNGLRIFDGQTWRPDISNKLQPNNRPVDDIGVDNEGRVWMGIGTQMNAPVGLYYYDGNEFLFFNMPLNYVSNIHCASNGNIWIATQGNYLSYNPISDINLIKISPSLEITPYTVVSLDLPGDYWFTGVDTQPNGDVWVSSRRNGVSKIKGVNF